MTGVVPQEPTRSRARCARGQSLPQSWPLGVAGVRAAFPARPAALGQKREKERHDERGPPPPQSGAQARGLPGSRRPGSLLAPPRTCLRAELPPAARPCEPAPRALQLRAPRLAPLAAAGRQGTEAGPPSGRRGVRCGGAGCSRGLSAGEAAALWVGSFLRERRPGRKHAPGAEGRLSQMTGSLRPSGCQAAGQTAERGVRERARAGPPGRRGARGRRSGRARPGFLGTAGRAAERGGRCRGRAPAPRAVLWSACGAGGFFSLWGRGLGDAAGTPAVRGGGGGGGAQSRV